MASPSQNPNLGPGSPNSPKSILPDLNSPSSNPANISPQPEGGATPPAPGPYTPLLNLAPDPFQRPSSPWAARYGSVSEEYLHSLDEFRHSNFAPEYPRLDARYYADDPDRNEKFHGFARGLHEDRLFYSELQQRCELKIYSWQVGPLNRYVSFGPRFPKVLGGHSRVRDDKDDPSSVIDAIHRLTGVGYTTNDDALMAVYHFEKIKVDESKWFKFFRRSRWWDPDPEAGHDSALGLQWSVDDPKVWAQFSVILELANRMLNALVDDEHDWLRTVLFGRLDYWANVRTYPPYEGARVLLSQYADRAACQSRSMPCFFDLHQTLPDWRFRLETILRNVRWTFKDDPDSKVMGVTDPARSGLIALDVTFLRLLCGDKITLSERCLLIVMVTTTVLHELMHHINHKRMFIEGADMNNHLDIDNDIRREAEPFVDYDGEAEIGSAFEKAVFGGVIEDSPHFGLPITVKYMTWPGFRGNPKLNLQHPSFSPDHWFKTWRIPSTWASTMLSSSFWDDPMLPRKSDNGFHITPLFVSHTRNEEPGPTTWGLVNVDRNVIPYASDLEKELIKEWDERMDQWAGFRQEWFGKAEDRWWTTPWSETGMRPALNAFAGFFRDHDEVQCAVEAQDLVTALPWDDAESFLQRLPPCDNIGWVYSAIGMHHLFIHLHPPRYTTKTTVLRGIQTGLLMLAACPMRKDYLTKESSEIIFIKGGPIRPSVMAQGLDPDIQVIERRTMKSYTDEIVVGPPLVGNPFKGISSAYARTQFDYLGMVFDLVEHFGMVGRTVCGPWLFEILRVSKLLQQERLRLRTEYPTDYETKWADSWDFQVPEYVSPNVRGGPHAELWVRWDQDANVWVGAELEEPPPQANSPDQESQMSNIP
ncbi:hypothetical protein F4782DRAFT_534448 [Xylaria castorea]|nr:hypothetical protein F4782DRAFT_534448 [Xylaria castorea]